MPDEEAENTDEELVTEVVQALSALNLSLVQDELEEFVHIDDENGEEFASAVLEDLDKLLQTMKICSEVQAETEETFDDLRKSFEPFQSKVWALSLKAKRKKL
ncbi:hypothetical protein AXG93_1054s1290 [Marchantia polymorpha subsp. ruderalis]|uniref:Uncharacterized protein n=1 Tax=Marchantia polymorpha subsp. ruderalis TaxID=1480154 RepID=A0A176WNB9_MARPO|nr:hypothetical protein AXG93_1054s1290 [Marchantia polymorpha subsp. ruderalis]